MQTFCSINYAGSLCLCFCENNIIQVADFYKLKEVSFTATTCENMRTR